MNRVWAATATAVLLAVGSPLGLGLGRAQDGPTDRTKAAIFEKFAGGRGTTGGRAKVQSYDSVITKNAKSSPGLFLVHQVDDKIYYEIPQSALGKELLWVTQLERTGAGRGYGGSPVNDRVVRWELRNEDVLLRDVNYTIRADANDPIQNAVEATTVEPILAVLPVKAYGKDKSLVIDVSDIFLGDMAEFSARRQLNASGADRAKTFLEKVKAFPENIETKVLVTYRTNGGGGGRGGPSPGPQIPALGGGDGGAVTVLLHHSMVKLPDVPMKPRKHDSRVGFFNVRFEDYGNGRNHQVENVRYINRWRLEKKDPSAEVSEPKKQIVYYIGREVPEKWKSWIKKGVELWQPAFEKAGFKNAIVAKDAPTPQQDPDWDAEDARYSSIRWLPATVENAMGPHVHDPRTGEILEADILMYHNVLKLIRDWYFVQASPSDPKAQKLPLSDELIGECLAYVVAHEVGHTLGFPHNMKGSSSYTVAQLRDPEFTKKNGTEASIMDYGRFNYVAQPGDNATLIPKIGPYDFFVVEWGYKEFPNAKSYEAEKAELDKIAARQVKDPTLRFGDPNPGEDPSQQTEDLGSDAVAVTELGLKNLDRVAGYLVKATSQPNENYDLLRNMYTQLVGQRNRELMHVANVVGGSVHANLYFGDADKVYSTVPGEQQKKAVAFLGAHSFQTPAALVANDIVERLEPNGAADRLVSAQRQILSTLLSDSRIKRMSEQAVRDPKSAYTPLELMNDLTSGIVGELRSESVEVDLYRRNLQRTYIELLGDKLKAEGATSDLPMLARGVLNDLKSLIDQANSKVKDPATGLHLADLQARIKQALEPKAVVNAAPATTTVTFPGRREP